VRLMNLSHAEALSRRFSYLATVTLPRGAIDIAGDLPGRDVTLVATTAYLVAREDFHPALVSVLLQAANRVHRGGGLFHRPGDFPQPSATSSPGRRFCNAICRSGWRT